MAARAKTGSKLLRLPLFLLIFGVASVAMYFPAIFAVTVDDHHSARSFFYAGTLGLIGVTIVALALGGRKPRHGDLGQLMALLATFAVLPLFLAVPVHDAIRTTSFLNAYFDMVSAVTTTGADVFGNPARLPEAVHLWRAMVGWLGGLLMWVAASAVLAPLSLGGFEVTARGIPGRSVAGHMSDGKMDPRFRLARVLRTLGPVYVGLTAVMWLSLLLAGDRSLVALCHAMSVMATSGISPVGGIENGASSIPGEGIMFLFLAFGLSRLTFSSDTAVAGGDKLYRDPEFRIGILIVVGVPLMLFLRHWIAALDVDAGEDFQTGLRALWGATFTVLSFLTTTGFVSAEWQSAHDWSGLNTPGIILLGLAVMGGGVATTAGGVKLLRVYALYLAGLREMERLVHPSSVSSTRSGAGRIQRGGAFIAWVFFMLFALSLTLTVVCFAATGASFEDSIVLAVAALSTTGPLTSAGAEAPIDLMAMGTGAKIIFCAAMVVGRLETLAIIALLSTDSWRR